MCLRLFFSGLFICENNGRKLISGLHCEIKRRTMSSSANSANRALKSLDWNKLLSKSSEDDYDSDETFCEVVDSKIFSPDKVNCKKIKNNESGSGFDRISFMNVVEEKSIDILLKDIKIHDSEAKPKKFLKPGQYYNIKKTKNSVPQYVDVIENNKDVLNDDNANGIRNFNKATCSTRQNCYEQKFEESFKLSDTNLDSYEANSEVDLSFLEEITQDASAPRFPTNTSSDEHHEIFESDENIVIGWGQRRRRRKNMFVEKKKLPERKCVSIFIKKSNRILQESTDDSLNGKMYSLSDKRDNQERNLLSIHQLNPPKKYQSKKRGRPLGIKKMLSTEQEDEKKIFGSSILQGLEDDLKELKRRLCKSIETREEAFQMLSHVQKITKTLRFHLEQANNQANNNKGKRTKNKRKFLLRYLVGQIEKSEELEKFLDEAISEADQITNMETDNESYEINDMLWNSESSNEMLDICKEDSTLKPILKNSMSSSESTKNSSEPRHISFSDEIEYRYLTNSTQSSDTREKRQSQEEDGVGPNIENDIGDFINLQTDMRKEVLERSDNPHDADPKTSYAQDTVCRSGSTFNFYGNEQPRIRTDAKYEEINKTHSTIFKTQQGGRKPHVWTNARLANADRENNSRILQNNSFQGTCSKSSHTQDGFSNGASSLLLFESENSETSIPMLKQMSKDSAFESEFRMNVASCDLFESENSDRGNNFAIGSQGGFPIKENDASFEAISGGTDCRSDTEGSFGFSELQPSLTEHAEVPHWQRVTIMDVKAVRIKQPGEFVDLEKFADGGKKFILDFDFSDEE